MKLPRHLLDAIFGVMLIVIGVFDGAIALVQRQPGAIFSLMVVAAGMMVMQLASIANYTPESKELLKLATSKNKSSAGPAAVGKDGPPPPPWVPPVSRPLTQVEKYVIIPACVLAAMVVFLIFNYFRL